MVCHVRSTFRFDVAGRRGAGRIGRDEAGVRRLGRRQVHDHRRDAGGGDAGVAGEGEIGPEAARAAGPGAAVRESSTRVGVSGTNNPSAEAPPCRR